MPMGSYIGGGFTGLKEANADGVIIDTDPGDLSREALNFPFKYSHVDDAVEYARKALEPWRSLPLNIRVEALRRYQTNLAEHHDELTEAITRDTGKPSWEASQEASSMVAKVEITIIEGLKRVKEYEIGGGRCTFHPRGVLAVIGPFNFPGHLPNGHIVPALLTGNTVVFKPSELAPMVGEVIAEIVHESKFLAGIFNMIQGRAEIGEKLVAHPGVDGVLFTGSWDAGCKIKSALVDEPHKIAALEMGGKNPAIVLKDANMDRALYETIVGANLTTGQRCSSTSRILLERPIADRFISRYVELAKQLKIGYGYDRNVFMGPLVSEKAQNKFFEYLLIAKDEGAEVLLKSEKVDVGRSGYYVSPSAHLPKSLDASSRYQGEEIFGPDVAFYIFDSVNEAIDIANASDYGLAASVFTREDYLFEKFMNHLQAGVINLNHSTVGASSVMPFGGLKRSGNDRPSAIFAVDYCTYPVATLKGPEDFVKQELMPGMKWIDGKNNNWSGRNSA